MTECPGYQKLNIFTLLRIRDHYKLLSICLSITCIYLVYQPLCILKRKVIDVEKQS